MKKIGLLGGTFNPIHNGHIMLAKAAYESCQLDEVWLLVSPDPPHKNDSVAAFRHRYKMVELAAEDYPNLIPSDYEIKLPTPSYTVHTLKALKAEFPDAEFSFVIAGDNLYDIELWHKPEEILKLTELIVARRNVGVKERNFDEQAEYIEKKYNAKLHKIDSANVDVSSTQIREMVKNGESIKGLVGDKVEEYITKEKLYR